MLRISTLTAIAVVLPGVALAVALPAEQYYATTQVTGLIDPAGICAGSSLFTVGSVTQGVATIAGLGLTWSQTQIATATASPYGASTIICTASALPAATAFTGSPPRAPYPGTSTCTTSLSGVTYTVTFSNNSGGSPPTTSVATSLANDGKAMACAWTRPTPG